MPHPGPQCPALHENFKRINKTIFTSIQYYKLQLRKYEATPLGLAEEEEEGQYPSFCTSSPTSNELAELSRSTPSYHPCEASYGGATFGLSPFLVGSMVPAQTSSQVASRRRVCGRDVLDMSCSSS